MDQRKAVFAGGEAVDLELPACVSCALAVRLVDPHDRPGEGNAAVNAIDDTTGNAGHGALLSGCCARGGANTKGSDDRKTDYDPGTHAAVLEKVTGSGVEPP